MMKQLLLTLKLSIATSLLGFVVIAAPVSAAQTGGAAQVAAIDSSKNAICKGAGLAGSGCGSSGGGLNRVVRGVLTILSVIAGVAAVIMVIISGFKYITSGGDAGKVGSAKTTLVYAIVGLVIVALAQVLVQFVFRQATS